MKQLASDIERMNSLSSYERMRNKEYQQVYSKFDELQREIFEKSIDLGELIAKSERAKPVVDRLYKRLGREAQPSRRNEIRDEFDEKIAHVILKDLGYADTAENIELLKKSGLMNIY